MIESILLILDFDSLIVHILVLQDTEDGHLASVEVVADLVEIVIKDVLEGAWLYGLQLIQNFLALHLLLILVVLHHQVKLTLGKFIEEFTLTQLHSLHAEGLKAKAVYVFGCEEVQVGEQSQPSTCTLQKVDDGLPSASIDRIPEYYRFSFDTVPDL